MTTGSGEFMTYTIPAGEDLDDLNRGTGDIHKAISITGVHARFAEETIGLLINGRKNGENSTIGISGVMKFISADVCSAFDRLTVVESGYLKPAVAGDKVVGRVGRDNVTSGSVGVGIFNGFGAAPQFENEKQDFTVGAFDLSAAGDVGKPVNLDAGNFAFLPTDAGGVLHYGTTSGGTSYAITQGLARLRAGDVVTADRSLTVNASAHFIDANSGDLIVARAIEASASGNSGSLFDGVLLGHKAYAVECFAVHY